MSKQQDYKHLQKGVAKKTATKILLWTDAGINRKLTSNSTKICPTILHAQTMSVQKFQSFIKSSCLGNRDKYLSWTSARINGV